MSLKPERAAKTSTPSEPVTDEPAAEGEAPGADAPAAEGEEPADEPAEGEDGDDEDEPGEDNAPAAKVGPSGPLSAAEEIPLGPAPNPFLKTVYYTLWYVAVPLAAAILFVWGMTPASGELESGPFAAVQAAVRSQPVPIAIVLFVLVAAGLMMVDHRLPLAKHAHPPLPPGVDPALRPLVGRARALLEEARHLRAKHNTKVSGRARQAARDATHNLERSLVAQPFDAEAFERSLTALDDVLDGTFADYRKGEVREYVESIGFAVLVALGLRALVVEAFKIPSGSMIPTLRVGDHIFVNKFIYGPAIPFTTARLWKNLPPKRGDVMVFAYPEDPEKDFIKRVIALPGDTLETRDGHPIINGWEVPSCLVGTFEFEEHEFGRTKRSGPLYVEYLGQESYLTLFTGTPDAGRKEGPFRVQPNQAFVMGDNRHNSHDSRAWFGGSGGGVPYENIRGKALFVWLSMDEKIDVSRFGAPVMGQPRLPKEMAHLQPALDKCLRERPAVTNPPPPR